MGQLTADDRFAIHELLAQYSRVIDTGRWEEFHTLFTPDGRLEFGPMGTFEGVEGLQRFAGMIRSVGNFMRHYVTNVTLSGDGERARGACYLLALTGPDAGKLTPSTGFYEDELVKRDGRWLLRARRILLDAARG